MVRQIKILIILHDILKIESSYGNNSILYNELQIIINQQSILSQKVSILLTINTFLIPIIYSIAVGTNFFWILFFLIPTLISLGMNIYILFPNFKKKSSKEKSRYFLDFAEMNEAEIEEYILKR